MAPRVNRWFVAVVAGCVAVAVGYLPPRGTAQRAREAALARAQEPTAEARRAAGLAREWRRADLELHMAQRRTALAPVLDRARNADRPTVLLSTEGAVDTATRARFATTLDSVWRRLGLGTTKIGAALILTAGTDTAGAAHPTRVSPFSPAYFFPDSLDRSTCLAVVSLSRSRQINPRMLREREGMLRRTLGPCAFYAAFGTPSPPIQRWLAARKYDLALDASWDRDGGHTRRGTAWFADFISVPASQSRWMWQWLYQADPATVGCIAGRARACSAYVSAGSGTERAPAAVAATDFERRGPPLPGVTELLSDMVREFGTARFARFWTSDQRVDSAFALAMDTTLGDWVAGRQLTLTPRLPLGPAAPLTASLLGLVLAAVALGGAALLATRRQIG